MTSQALTLRLRRTARQHRRLLACLCTGLAVLLGLSALTPPAPTTTAVVVAARDLPAGQRLGADDLRLAHYPPSLVPVGAHEQTDAVLGEMIAVAASEGSVVTTSSLVQAGTTAGKGELLVPFSLADATVLPLLHVGDRVTVVTAGDDGQAITLASRVRVAALPQPSSDQAGSDSRGAVVVAAAPVETARRLAAWTGSGRLGIALG